MSLLERVEILLLSERKKKNIFFKLLINYLDTQIFQRQIFQVCSLLVVEVLLLLRAKLLKQENHLYDMTYCLNLLLSINNLHHKKVNRSLFLKNLIVTCMKWLTILLMRKHQSHLLYILLSINRLTFLELWTKWFRNS
jgi:hypothetical protein